MQPKAIIFDVDGTLADTERWGHLPACNEVMQAIGLDLQWTWNEFKELIYIPGTANRLRYELERQFPHLSDQHDSIVEQFGPLKKKLYNEKYVKRVQLREGIADCLQAIVERNIRLAIVSTSYETQIHKLLETRLPEYQHLFNPILGKESGLKTGPEGALYEKCLELMELKPEECLVIEDSEGGFMAAKKARIPTAVFYNEYTEGQNFDGAVLIASGLDQIDTTALLQGTYLTQIHTD